MTALLATARGALWLSADGEIERLSGPEAALRAAGSFPLVVHGPATAARLALASPDLKDTALTMARGDWPWGAEVLAALGIDQPAKKPRPSAGLDVWRLLPNWEEPPPAT